MERMQDKTGLGRFEDRPMKDKDQDNTKTSEG